MALRYSARGALCFGCSRLASSVAAARISRLLRPTSALEYLLEMISPCSVIRIWPFTAPPDRAAAAVKQPQADVVALEHLDQVDFRLVELPARGDEAAILVAVGVAEHDFLNAAAAVDQLAVVVNRQHAVHNAAGSLQILDGLEQRHDIDRAAA